MSVKQEIKRLVKFAKTDKTPTNKKVAINVILEKEAKLLNLKTGLNLSGYTRIIDKSSIIHSIKQHGNSQKEALRGQIAITDNDFELIPKIVKSKNIIYAGKTKLGNDCVLYEHIENEVFFYIEEVRTGKKELCLQTMYKRKPPKK